MAHVRPHLFPGEDPASHSTARVYKRTLLLVLLTIASVLVTMTVSTAAGSSELARRDAGLPLCGRHGTTSGAVHAWRMGAVQFLSPTTGIGLTASTLICFEQGKTGSQVSFKAQPVSVALSNDGGQSWRLTGTAAPTGPTPSTASGEQLVAASPARIWAIVGKGRLLATADGGRSWRRVTFPGPVVELTRSGNRIWAATCLHVTSSSWPLACRPQLWRAPIGTGFWTQVSLPNLTAQDPDVHLTIASGQSMLLDLLPATRSVTGEMAISTNGGSTWRTRPDPTWDGHSCMSAGDLTAAPPRTFWLLCLGGAAAGSSTKALLRSTNSGGTWSAVSAVTSLTRKPPSDSIPLAEPSALAAGSAQRVWLSTTNWLAESDNAGRTWADVSSAFDPGGWPTVISVLDATHAWLLAPGAGLWSTTDGAHWKPTGPLHTE
jgi:photosystem II stability/assembly factor-like uncharacterized protein